MPAANPKEATELLRERVRAAETVRQCVGRQVGINRCMFVGRHWITEGMMSAYLTTNGYQLTNLNPDTNQLRLVLNRIPRFIHETAAASFPARMDFDVAPPPRDMGTESMFRARVLENTLASFVKNSGFLASARDASYRRCIDGLHCIGLCIRREPRNIKGRTEFDSIAKTFTFDAHRLILDPGNQSMDLWDHEHVTYRDVWTVTKIERELGVKLDSNELKTVGELMPFETAINIASLNHLYSHLRDYSTTKGAYVSWMHEKGPSGTFPTMLIGIDSGDQDTKWVNWDDQETPFGGNGLPYMMLHGYREPDSMVSRSDVSLLKNDQDQINLLATMSARVLQRFAGPQWRVAVGSMDGDGIDDYKSYFTNNVGGVIPYKPGTRDRPMPPPELVIPPTPSPYFAELIALHQERDMPSQIHRPPVSVGQTKSHVPDSTFQSALQQAGQVLGNRGEEDRERYQVFATMMLGTIVKQAQKGSPTALANLRRDGFKPEDFAVLSEVDPVYPACDITLKESSIKYRSTEQKEQALDRAAELQMMTAEEYRQAKADLDTPLTEEDRIYDSQAKRWAMRVLLGEQWQPRSLGKGTPFFLKWFRLAMQDDRADPAALQRLDVAVATMLAIANQEMMDQAMAENPPAPAAEPGAAEGQQQEMPQEVNIADLITSLNSGGGQAPVQGTAA